MQNNEKGLSLIEVLVSLVILVIGLIGVFNLHLISKQGSFESFQQTQASYLAHDIINRMKANSSQLPSYEGEYSSMPTSTPNNLCNDVSDPCTAVEMRMANLYQWQKALTGQYEIDDKTPIGGLDEPTACITVKDEKVEVKITWKAIRETTDAKDANEKCGTASKKRRFYVVTTFIRSNV
ncbi:type IV pilus modification protein PilV [Parashewanella tropica]|uniref:type IV pilus modification protein PilV n=1 Tax=Parashewanella tropica TaxID=2547970 RepID=UPI001059C9C3|nr:type IV pilus modification protein PilV [Parashewanella tropica]